METFKLLLKKISGKKTHLQAIALAIYMTAYTQNWINVDYNTHQLILAALGSGMVISMRSGVAKTQKAIDKTGEASDPK
jgi:hypothetical protein